MVTNNDVNKKSTPSAGTVSASGGCIEASHTEGSKCEARDQKSSSDAGGGGLGGLGGHGCVERR